MMVKISGLVHSKISHLYFHIGLENSLHKFYCTCDVHLRVCVFERGFDIVGSFIVSMSVEYHSSYFFFTIFGMILLWPMQPFYVMLFDT